MFCSLLNVKLFSVSLDEWAARKARQKKGLREHVEIEENGQDALRDINIEVDVGNAPDNDTQMQEAQQASKVLTDSWPCRLFLLSFNINLFRDALRL